MSALTVPSHEARERFRAAPRTAEAHRAMMADVPAISEVERGGTPRAERLGKRMRVAAWNLERCYDPDRCAAHLSQRAPDVVLLSEVDNGMARTGQRHTTAEIAAQLDMSYLYAVEFLELDLGSPRELAFCKDDFNARGFHGNALLSAAPLDRVGLVRLEDEGRWFAASPGELRIGERNAILATAPMEGGPVCLVSTHFESNTQAALRDAQMRTLIAAIDAFAPGMPVVVGGDLNTGNRMPNDDHRLETLFDTAREAGYSFDGNPDGMTTGPSLITPNPTGAMKLDWFMTRGLTPSDGMIADHVSSDGVPLSDHKPIFVTLERA